MANLIDVSLMSPTVRQSSLIPGNLRPQEQYLVRFDGAASDNGLKAVTAVVARPAGHPGPSGAGRDRHGQPRHGLARARHTCTSVAALMGLQASQVLPFSTGVIMETLPVNASTRRCKIQAPSRIRTCSIH